MTMESIDDSTRSDILSHLNSTCQSMHMSIPPTPTSPPLTPLVPNCSTHEDPCYHCYPLPFPQPHFMSQPPELLPGHSLGRPQPFGHHTTTTNHSKSPPVIHFEKVQKSLTKSHSDSSLVKIPHRQGHPFAISSETQCHSSPTSPKSSAPTLNNTRDPPMPRPEPVWRPW